MKPARTGIFYTKDLSGLVVMQPGKEIARSKNVSDLVTSHQEGLCASKDRDEKPEQILAEQYLPYPPKD